MVPFYGINGNVNRKHRKTLELIFSRPVSGNIKWVDIKGLLKGLGAVKLTGLRTYAAPWTLHKLLILRSSADRFRLQTPSILLNLTVPFSLIQDPLSPRAPLPIRYPFRMVST